MGSFTRKEQIGILIVVLVVMISAGYKFFLQDFLKEKDDGFGLIENHMQDMNNGEDIIESADDSNEPYEIMVHVSGEVYRPGLVTLVNGDRVIDAVNLSGGLKNEADLDRINLAKKVQDEEKIHIPSIGEETSVSVEGLVTTEGKININTCTKSDLETLPGIGDKTADKILEYRNGNTFKRIEDIMNVSGIGEKKFDSIKDLIVVN